MHDNLFLAEEEMVEAAGEFPALSTGLRVRTIAAVTKARHRRAVRRRVATVTCLLVGVGAMLSWGRVSAPEIASVHAAETQPKHLTDGTPLLFSLSGNDTEDMVIVFSSTDEWDLVDEIRKELHTRPSRVFRRP